MTLRLATIVLFCFLNGGLILAADGAPRIAIISGPNSGDLAALVTTELSGNAALSLVERDDLAKVGDELKIQQLAGTDSVALGKLINADGLLFIDKRNDGLQVRFTAVGLGYELFDDPIATDANLPQLAKTIAHRVSGYADKLKLDPARAIPLSVLNFRADFGSPQAMTVERNLTLLLESRLTAVPEYVVLERRHAWSLGFEHSLDPAAKPLLHGAYLIDGTLSLPSVSSSSCTVAMRLRRPDGQQTEVTAQGTADDLSPLVDQLLGQIQKTLGGTGAAPAPAADREAQEYFSEALWGWRANAPEVALEAVDSAELLGTPPEEVVPLRLQILCAIADQGMGDWYPSFSQNIPKFDAPDLDKKMEILRRVIPEAARYRNEKLEEKISNFVPSNGVERFKFRTGETLAKVVGISSKTLILLELAGSPHADELRQLLRTITGYDPLNGKPGAVPTGYLANNANAADVFADDWAQTLEEELAWLRLSFVDTKQVLPRQRLSNPAQTFCARFLKTPEEREKAFVDFVESLKNVPQSQRAYLVLKTHEKDPIAANAAYLEYLDYLKPHYEEFASGSDYSPLVESAWSIAGNVTQQNAKAALPLVHAVLTSENPGRNGMIVLQNLWKPAETDPADAAAIWKESQAYVKRCADITMQKEGHASPVLIAQMDSILYNFKSKFPDIVNAPVPDAPGAAESLVVTKFWYPWMASNTPGDNNVIFSAVRVGSDDIWIAGFINRLETGRIFKIHLPDLQTETIDAMDGKYIQGLLWTPQALYAPLGSDTASQGFKRQLARYDFSTSSWTKRDLPIAFSPGKIFAVNGDIYFSTGLRGATLGDEESGIAKYNWDADKVTLLADNRRRPGQNQFDDTAAYRIISVFPGPGNKPSVTSNSGTFYIQESPGIWPPVFDGRFNDEVVTSNDQTMVFNQMGEAMLIDPKAPETIPWMAADEPIYRKAKGLPGVTGPVATPWAAQTIWDCPPGKRKQMSGKTVAFHDDRLFILTKPSQTENRYELLCYDKTRGRKPTHIPLKFELNDTAKAALSLHPGHMPNGWSLAEIEQPHMPFDPDLLATNQGLCLKLMVAGFWFVPYGDIEDYLKKHPENPTEPTPSTAAPPAVTSTHAGGDVIDPNSPTSFR